MCNSKFSFCDKRFPKRRFWTFKHKPGREGTGLVPSYVRYAYEMGVCFMQYEYAHQDPGRVTRHWELAKEIKEGDVLFLRGDSCIYAFGVVVPHGITLDEGAQCSNIEETIRNGSNGSLDSGCYDGKVIFSDSEVFFEDLGDVWFDEDEESSEEGFGQRIKVQKWLCYSKGGVWCLSDDYYIVKDRQSTIREVTPEAARVFITELSKKYYESIGVDEMMLEVLKRNKNLVLTGAPGTGKTFLAGVLAKGLTGGDENRILRVQFHPSYGYSDFVEGLRPIMNKDGVNQIGFKRQDGEFMRLCREALKNQDERYVVIIDEINRGDISKIFGELFSLIEAGYRTLDGKLDETPVAVKTQYNNLMDDGDDFKNGFFVPPNVYIIGTMNDVDRSVESMDFAIRRRFVWHEVKPNDRFDAMWGEENEGVSRETAKERMNALNAMISNDPTLGEAYQIGPSYFMKLKDLNGDYERLWNQSLRLLLKEYLRGIPDAQKKLDDFHAILVKGSVE